MPRKRNTLHEIRSSDGRIFEVWCATAKEALSLAQHRHWAHTPSHAGLRRILRTVPGNWPVLVEESNYITALRNGNAKKKRTAEEEQERASHSEARRLVREAAENAAYAARLVTMKADQAARRERRAAIDARLGRTRRIPDLPAFDPDSNEWV